MRKLAIAVVGGFAAAGIVMLGATLFGPPLMSAELAFSAAPGQWTEMVQDLSVLLRPRWA